MQHHVAESPEDRAALMKSLQSRDPIQDRWDARRHKDPGHVAVPSRTV